MNFLAHAYLSFGHQEVLVGNLISDFVKGKTRFNYPPMVQAGITLHRQIDSFTDEHPATRHAKEFFRNHYRLYSAAFVDVVYDHFLANDPGIFPGETLLAFSGLVYESLDKYQGLLPAPFTSMYPYMKTQNWLYNYRHPEGIRRSFGGLVRRASYMSESDTAFAIFQEHYESLQEDYLLFAPQVIRFAQSKFWDLIA